MLTPHELFGFMSPGLATRILEHVLETNKNLYRTVLSAVADARKVRPVFLERTPRKERHEGMIAMLSRPRLELQAAGLLREWLMKKELPMLTDFLDSLGISHKEGAVDDLPAQVEDDKLKAAVDLILGKYPAEEVAVYLNAFYSMNDVHWPNLEVLLQNEPRLQFGG